MKKTILVIAALIITFASEAQVNMAHQANPQSNSTDTSSRKMKTKNTRKATKTKNHMNSADTTSTNGMNSRTNGNMR